MELSLLIDKIKRDKGLDLSGYKESTIARRIERRIKFDGASSLDEYIRMIDRDYHLYWRLVSDFFIGVTDFFRDKEIWDVVREKVLPEFVVRRASCVLREENNAIRNTHHAMRNTGPLRIWSAGCSTGEETYSLAIAVKEVLRKSVHGPRSTIHDPRTTVHEPPVFIYGTDIMEDKLEIAKEGVYSEEKLKNINGDIKFRYFSRSSSVNRESSNDPRTTIHDTRSTRYEIQNEVRRLARFRKYDLTKPETLTGFDIVACRNVLIYFQRSLQEKVLKNFHRALRENGILWLGTAESLSREAAKLFEPIHKNEKIFKKM